MAKVALTQSFIQAFTNTNVILVHGEFSPPMIVDVWINGEKYSPSNVKVELNLVTVTLSAIHSGYVVIA